MAKPIGVITDSFPSYLLFLHESGLKPKQAVYVDAPQKVLGCELSGVIRVGNWRALVNVEDLASFAESRVR